MRQDYIFQQEGAPAHHSSLARNYSDYKRPNNWIERGGPVDWPPRSPDLTPSDFFLWGHIKSKVYDAPIYTIEELKTRIRQECRNVRSETLKKVGDNQKLRLNQLSQVNGAHIESLMS